MNNHPDCMMPDGADPCEGYKTLCREVEYLRWENERVRRRVVQALMEINDRTDGDFPALDNALGAIEALLTGEDPKARNPAWLPSPDTKPPELADAQIVRVRGYPTKAELRFAAKDAPWGHDAEYRPLYSDSGLPLCSPEGLRPRTLYVATDDMGEVREFFTKPVALPSGVWGGEWVAGPESHRRPGPWYGSLMEVMR